MEYKVNNSNLLEAVDTVELPERRMVSGRVRVTFADGERARVATDPDAPITLRKVQYRANMWFKRDESGAWSLWQDDIAELWRYGTIESASRANRELVAGVFAEVLTQEASPHTLALGEHVAAESAYTDAVDAYDTARAAYEEASRVRAAALVRKQQAWDALTLVESAPPAEPRAHRWLPPIEPLSGIRTCGRLGCYAQWMPRKAEPSGCKGTDSE